MPRIIVISETPSLGEAILDLFGAEGWDAEGVPSLARAEALERKKPSSRPPLLVAACNEHRCQSPRLWGQSALRSSPLVVVGNRDPEILRLTGVHVVGLPLRSTELLDLIRGLLGSN